MRIALSAAVALALLGATAHAGGYLAIGVGTDAHLRGDMATHFSAEGASSGRLVLGERVGPLAVEASLFGTDLRGTSAMTGADADLASLSLGVDLKYHIELAGRLEAYARGGLHRAWITGRDGGADLGYSGRGHQYGGGLQYSLSAGPVIGAALWLDYTRQVLDLTDDGRPRLQGTADMVTLGLSLGRF